jgi:hypothetical protein
MSVQQSDTAESNGKKRTTRRSTSARDQRLRRLASLIARLDERRRARDEFDAQLEPLRRAGLMAIVGEDGLLAAVNVNLTKAEQLLAELKADTTVAKIEERMKNLETALESFEWDVVEQARGGLEDKRIKQDAVIRELQDKVDGWRNHVELLRKAIVDADAVQAPVPMERNALNRLDSLLGLAERSLLDQRYADITDPLDRLEREDAPAGLIERVDDKSASAKRFNRQADVLLLRASTEEMHAYTVLLRTPSAPGSHGINIQDSSSLVDQDREYIRDVIAQVTKAVDEGLVRRFQTRGGAPAEAAQADVRREWQPAAQPGNGTATRPDDLRALITDVGNVMFRLFMPDRMREYLSSTPCALTITTNDLELPWELMYDSGWEEEPGESGLGFLCLQRPVARMPMGRAFPRIRRPTAQKDKLRFLLVYADPDDNLPAAGREVRRIRDELQERWKRPGEEIKIDLLDRDKATGKEMNQALLSGSYDVIHFAGHAYFDNDDPDKSGFVLKEKEIFLSQKIQRFVEGQPLVFLNACQTGVTANETNPQSVGEYFWKPAEGLASAFLYGGALGCVGSLWPVYDEPAAEFAVEFYNQVLEGQMIGEAMRRTRRSIKTKHPDSITWASFVLYGDPTFRLVR